DVPAAALHALGGRLEPLPDEGWVADACSCKIESDAPHAGKAHGVELALRGLVIDDRDTARVRTACFHSIERGRVVSTVDAWRDDSRAWYMQRFVEGPQPFGQRRLGGIGPPRKIRELLGITVDVSMAIASTSRYFEVHRRGRLGCLGMGRLSTHGGSNRNG